MSFFSGLPFGTSVIATDLDPTKLVIVPDRFNLLPQVPQIINTMSPMIAFSNNQFLKPFVSYPLDPSLDLNRDPNVHRTVTDSIYKYTFQEWLYSRDFEEVFKYIKIVGGEPKLVSGSERDHNGSDAHIDKKIRFIRDHILSYERVRKLIEEFLDGTRTNWYDVEKNIFFVKELILKYMKKKLKTLAEEKKKLRR